MPQLPRRRRMADDLDGSERHVCGGWRGFLDEHGVRWTPSIRLVTGRFGVRVPGGAPRGPALAGRFSAVPGIRVAAATSVIYRPFPNRSLRPVFGHPGRGPALNRGPARPLRTSSPSPSPTSASTTICAGGSSTKRPRARPAVHRRRPPPFGPTPSTSSRTPASPATSAQRPCPPPPCGGRSLPLSADLVVGRTAGVAPGPVVGDQVSCLDHLSATTSSSPSAAPIGCRSHPPYTAWTEKPAAASDTRSSSKVRKRRSAVEASCVPSSKW